MGGMMFTLEKAARFRREQGSTSEEKQYDSFHEKAGLLDK